MLRWRLILGVTLIAALAGLCFADSRAAAPGVALFPVALGVGLLATGELLNLFRARGVAPAAWAVWWGTGLIVASNAVAIYWPLAGKPYPPDCPVGRLGWPLGATAVALALALVAEMRRYTQPGSVTTSLAAAAWSFLYVGVLWSFVIQLRQFHDGPTGLVALAALVAVVKGCDIGAYTVGRLCGRHKMTPIISPGKTWEGAAGGLAFACFAAWATFHYLPNALGATLPADRPSWGWAAFGVVVGSAGILGDLAESLLKRDAGVKDSSPWLPGFGGVLDIIDSLLFAAPWAYACFTLGIM